MNNEDLGILQYANTFAAVAQTQSIRKAAEQLNLTPSAVSYQITRLEDQLGVTLFERSKGQKLTMLKAGEDLLIRLQPIFGAVARLRRDMSGAPGSRSLLRVGFEPCLIGKLTPLLPAFIPQKPRTSLACTLQPGNVLADALTSNELDFAFIFQDLVPPSCDFCFLFNTPLVLLANDAFREKINMNDISGSTRTMPWVAFLPKGAEQKRMTSLDHFTMLNINEPDIVLMTDDLYQAITAVVDGIGICVLPEIALSLRPRVRLNICRLGDAVMPRRVTLAWLKDQPRTLAQQSFFDAVMAKYTPIH